MAISANAISPTQSNPYAAIAAGTNPGAGTNPMNLQAVNTPSVNPASLAVNSGSAVNTLAGNAPQSLTALLMPLFSQLFGSQTGALAQTTALQGQQGVAQAQSDAMKRGLTGSSIESSGMQGALASSQHDYTQGYAALLGNYVNAYAGAAGTDVSNQQSYYSNLAQALGQSYAQQVQQTEFNQQLQAGISEANQAHKYDQLNAILSGAPKSVSFSDVRLKKNLVKIGRRFGLDVYQYEYDAARAPHLRLSPGKHIGFLAHQVADRFPEAVLLLKGYLAVDYNKLADVALA